MHSAEAVAALAQVGRAILLSQMLEKLLIEMFEFRKLHLDFDYAIETGGVVAPKLYKNPLMNGIQLLQKQDALDATVDEALVQYIEDRHILVHRWLFANQLPDDKDSKGWAALLVQATKVAKQATGLYGFIASYIAEHARLDIAAKDYATYQQRMLSMLNRKYAE